MNFDYKVENGEVTITGIIDDSSNHFLIPKSIKSLPINKVLLDTNKYVIWERYIYKIKYCICGDYIVYNEVYIIDGNYFKSDLMIYYLNINRINCDIPLILPHKISSIYGF